MGTLSEGLEYARRLRSLIREANGSGYYLHVDGQDLDLRDSGNDDYITTIDLIEVDR